MLSFTVLLLGFTTVRPLLSVPTPALTRPFLMPSPLAAHPHFHAHHQPQSSARLVPEP
ncbi:hypothetical protein E2C01_077139 [Portunus trituberculatus]|uniref:Uncharacterized protein n=1 Tax=Portunus trituberculatus TaxID=210409 RepID=A0A5B7IDL1_PORTR|nr:hypothetical protein [Portunus trituberculatus]